jgi:surface antigen
MRLEKILWISLVSLLLTNSASWGRSEVGAGLGTVTTTGACIQMGVDNPYVIAGCAVAGAFAGAEIMYKSDYDVHNAVFVDHLNNGPSTQSYTNWYNQKSGNSGIIKVTRSYLEGPFKCKDYDATIDIANQWPLIGVGGVNRKVVFGTACQLPDGRWIEKPTMVKK